MDITLSHNNLKIFDCSAELLSNLLSKTISSEIIESGKIELSELQLSDSRAFENLILAGLKKNLFRSKKTIFANFPVHYHIIPPILRGVLMRLSTTIKNPDIANKLKSANYCGTILNARYRELFGDRYCFPNCRDLEYKKILLTLDIDSQTGYKNIDKFVEFLTLRANSARIKTIIFLPAAGFKFSAKHLSDIRAASIELGCHGYDHSGKLAFDSDEIMRRKFAEIYEFSRKFQINKFRAPAFVVTERMYDYIKQFFAEDYSFRDVCVIKNRITGAFFAAQINDSNLKLKILNTFPDCDLFSAGLNHNDIIEILTKKILHLIDFKIQPILLFHSEPHFSGSKTRFDLFRKIIENILYSIDNI